MTQDEHAGFSCHAVNLAAFDHLQQAISEALREEQEAGRKHHTEAWKEWVGTAQTNHKGWAHRWTGLKEPWRPVRASEAYTGKPLEALKEGADAIRYNLAMPRGASCPL
jgi:hypothetical protein